MPHAGARRRPRPPRGSSSPAAASSTPELVGAGRVRAAGVSRICAAPTVACALASEGGERGALSRLRELHPIIVADAPTFMRIFKSIPKIFSSACITQPSGPGFDPSLYH
uniref:Uncharacterized protein n=1 Tax=Oryza rufipogon TaxID=4529 RepID=A0A0E0P5X1_ORYRU